MTKGGLVLDEDCWEEVVAPGAGGGVSVVVLLLLLLLLLLLSAVLVVRALVLLFRNAVRFLVIALGVPAGLVVLLLDPLHQARNKLL
jgi:phosphoglycerol transferase MdoB-like AlkP superfamily enzyme